LLVDEPFMEDVSWKKIWSGTLVFEGVVVWFIDNPLKDAVSMFGKFWSGWFQKHLGAISATIVYVRFLGHSCTYNVGRFLLLKQKRH
jgi:hypothetical protein